MTRHLRSLSVHQEQGLPAHEWHHESLKNEWLSGTNFTARAVRSPAM